ncbi:ATP-binding protein [Massilia sp. TS11]|uniref:ATP-binding protein n=1 Tax=Massilia sp. TS11 TaxID=2908003 RepID=UPI001EDC26BC|nr:ATP-binding protein [Massilia sp. TS11]MCG2584120.1 ATP-binding protein [Massilia sp. TS11]
MDEAHNLAAHPFAEASPSQIMALLDSMPDGFITLDAVWRITYLNAYALEYTGRMQRSKADLLGRSIWEAFPELAGTHVEPHFRQSQASGSPVAFEFYFPPLASWFEVRTYPAAAGLIVYFRDITQRKNDEDQLRQSEEMLRVLANSIPQLAWVTDANGEAIWFNQRWYEFTGADPAEGARRNWNDLHDPAYLPGVLAHWRDCLRTGSVFEMEFPLRGRDGEFRWFLTRINPLRDRYGLVVRWFGTNTDVDQVKRAQEALREETKMLELLNSTGLALTAERDLHALLQTVTDAATQLSGASYGAFFYTKADAGRPVQISVAGQGSASFAEWCEPLSQSAHGLRVDDLGAEAMGAAQRAYPGHAPVRSLLAVPVRSRAGQGWGVLVFGHPEPSVFSERAERMVAGIAAQAAVAIDNARLYEASQQAADERRILLERERQARAEAEHTSQMKDEFLATLSHELRTPLSAILGWAQLLRRQPREMSDWQRGLETIERNARVQAQLVDDLLDMSRITAGKVLLDVQLLSADGFVDAAIETVRPAADAKQIRIERAIAPDAGLIAGDPARLQQVVWNLLSNAIKFTPREGLVRVDVRALPDHLEISVADSGIGIRPEFLPHVFERFRQGDASIARRHGGLGLGLAIVKHLVEQHGGTVRAESDGEHCGAAFSLLLPLAKPGQRPLRPERADPNAAPTPSAGALADLSGLRALVVDDEADARELVQRLLVECGARVQTAASAAEALLLLKREPPDLLVSDLGMPGVDGFALLAQIRHLAPDQGGCVPALALTALARPEDRARALATGFAAHVAKPVDAADLVSAVREAVGHDGTIKLPT